MHVELGPALTYFFNNAEMNLYQGKISINLMDYFPILKQGYAKLSTVDNMIYNYVILNNLTDPTNENSIIPDNLFSKAFNGYLSDRIPALYYLLSDGEKIPMQDAVNRNLIDSYLKINTFQVFKLNPEKYDIDYHYIADINTIPIEDTIYGLYKPIKGDTSHENRLSNQIMEILQTNNNPTFEDFIKAVSDKYLNDIYDELVNNQWTYLLLIIIKSNHERVRELLKNVDPRINNNEAYRLALKTGNRGIIKMIVDNIRYRTDLDRRATSTRFINQSIYM